MNNGVYTIYRNGEEVGKFTNLITNAAKPALMDFLAGKTQSWAGAIAVGVHDTAPAATNTNLNFEVARSNINVREPRYADGKIVVKATLPLNLIIEIYELGLFNTPISSGEDSNSYILSRFSPEFDEVVGVSSTGGRFGSDSALLSMTTTSEQFSVEELGIDLGALSDRDKFLFAYDADNITNITVSLYNEDGNFVSSSFGAVAGFNVQELLVSSFTGTGTLESPISRIVIAADGTAGGSLVAEGMRFHSSTLDDDDILMSHATLTTPVVKDAGEEMDIEFSVTFGGLSG